MRLRGEEELNRVELNRVEFDQQYPRPVLGMDEVGTGCVAGPIYAAGVVLPQEPALLEALQKAGLRDSKRCTKPTIERIVRMLDESCVLYFIAGADPRTIERYGNGGVLRRMFAALHNRFRLTACPKTTLIDGASPGRLGFRHKAVVKGDDKSLTIAAASVLAKAARDRFMASLPEAAIYGWGDNAGYPTRLHREAMYEHGLSEHHRRNTKTVEALLDEVVIIASPGSPLSAAS